MMFNDETLSSLRSKVCKNISDKRYKHTLGVEKMARYLGKIIIPDKVNELSVAALLHDIAKEHSYEEHLDLVSTLDYITKDDLETKPALHSYAAVNLIKKEYPEFATCDVLSAVANHTLGNPEMSVFDEIIFISDYAEEGRTYKSCVEVHSYLMANVSKENKYEDNLFALHNASYKAILSTIFSLSSRNEKINGRTFLTKEYFEGLISK